MIPDEVIKRFEEGKCWAGANQTMRMIDNGNAKIILIGNDVSPKEIIAPLIKAAEEKNIELYLAKRKEIGKIAKCPRPTSAACLV